MSNKEIPSSYRKIEDEDLTHSSEFGLFLVILIILGYPSILTIYEFILS